MEAQGQVGGARWWGQRLERRHGWLVLPPATREMGEATCCSRTACRAARQWGISLQFSGDRAQWAPLVRLDVASLYPQVPLVPSELPQGSPVASSRKTSPNKSVQCTLGLCYESRMWAFTSLWTWQDAKLAHDRLFGGFVVQAALEATWWTAQSPKPMDLESKNTSVLLKLKKKSCFIYRHKPSAASLTTPDRNSTPAVWGSVYRPQLASWASCLWSLAVSARNCVTSGKLSPVTQSSPLRSGSGHNPLSYRAMVGHSL